MELQKLIDGLKAHKWGAASYESVDEAIRVFEAMRDVDREKVCKGLECCILLDPDDKSRCDACTYDGACANRLKVEALALIRQQQERIKELEAGQTARVMTLEEAKKAEVCWLEHRGYEPFATLEAGTWNSEKYGKSYRCWNRMPTDEQRKAVKWDAAD